MYYNHQLRANLQEWKTRLYKTEFVDIDTEFKFFIKKILNEPILISIINDINQEYFIDENALNKYKEQLSYSQPSYKDERERFSYYWGLCNNLYLKADHYADYDVFYAKNYTDGIRYFLERIVTPILNYLHESLDNISYILYILEKYKLRTEWFTKDSLREKYDKEKEKKSRQYEQVLEDDIRLYLFDQGIDYPFSTPKSASGRADIVSLVNTEDPLVMEIKIYDSERRYGKERIISGFTQIVKYANDYHKNVGYLVVFNLDEIEIEIENIEPDNKFPNRVIFNGKTYYIIVVNLNYDTSASNLKKLNKVTIPYNELTSLKI